LYLQGGVCSWGWGGGCEGGVWTCFWEGVFGDLAGGWGKDVSDVSGCAYLRWGRCWVMRFAFAFDGLRYLQLAALLYVILFPLIHVMYACLLAWHHERFAYPIFVTSGCVCQFSMDLAFRMSGQLIIAASLKSITYTFIILPGSDLAAADRFI
jgi:hypothetical protein